MPQSISFWTLLMPEDPQRDLEVRLNNGLKDLQDRLIDGLYSVLLPGRKTLTTEILNHWFLSAFRSLLYPWRSELTAEIAANLNVNVDTFKWKINLEYPFESARDRKMKRGMKGNEFALALGVYTHAYLCALTELIDKPQFRILHEGLSRTTHQVEAGLCALARSPSGESISLETIYRWLFKNPLVIPEFVSKNIAYRLPQQRVYETSTFVGKIADGLAEREKD